MGLFEAKKDNDNVTQRFAGGGYVKQYKDSTTERVRFIKTREALDLDGPSTKAASGVRENKEAF